jgi:RNA polymerase sigma-70 factor (ECF subfamily)
MHRIQCSGTSLSDPGVVRGWTVIMNDASDTALLAGFRDGDQEAFAVLVARYHGLVRAACQRQAPSPEVEDCLQAVFLVLARRPASASRAPSLPAWLLRVAWFVCRRARRGARRRLVAERSAAQAGNAQGTIRPEALDHLDDCLSALPERQRVAVSLHYLAALPAEQVAATLGVSRDNAYQLVSRGLARLRKLLAQRGIVIGAPALLALFTAESQAADTNDGAPASITQAITGQPSANAAVLAKEAAAAMAIPFLPGAILVAVLAILTTGLTLVVGADGPERSSSLVPRELPQQAGDQARDQPRSTGSVDAGTTATSIWPRVDLTGADQYLLDRLEQRITVDFRELQLSDISEFIHQTTGTRCEVRPLAVGSVRINLQVRDMSLRDALYHLCEAADLSLRCVDQALVFSAVGGDGDLGKAVITTPGTF